MKRTILIILLLIACYPLMATHIVGGEMYYDHLGNNEYQITLIVYRDCDPNTNTNNTDFDPSAAVGIYRNQELFTELFIDLVESNVSELPVALDNPCFILPPSLCVERATYQATIVLPSSIFAYHLVYQRCCRNPTIINLFIPEDTGATFTTNIPGSISAPDKNSSARFNDFPPVALCANAAFTFDHSATDPDGDSLVYEFCSPFLGGTPFDPAPIPPTGPPFTPVTYAVGFSATDPITADPVFNIDPVTGELSGTPNAIGQYVIGICVREFRNGVEINRSNRDFQFNVVSCDPVIIAAIPEQESFCDGLNFQFSQESTNATFFYWDFGDPTTDEDFSEDPEPTYTYPDTGFYEVTMIANPGWPCADTTVEVYAAFPDLAPAIIELDVGCEGTSSSYSFSAGGQIEDEDASYSWDFGPNSSPSIATGNTVDGIVLQPGIAQEISLEVTANDCTENAILEVIVPEEAIAVIPEQEIFCDGFLYEFENESENADSFSWEFGDPDTEDDFSNLENPTYEYPGPGQYIVELFAFNENGCADTDALAIEINTLLDPSFTPPEPQCFDDHNIQLVAQGSAFLNSNITWDFGESASPGQSTDAIVNNLQFSTPGWQVITLSISENGCERFYTDSLRLLMNPTVDLSIEGAEGCSPLTVQFENQSESDLPLVYSWDFGDGSSSEQANPSHVYTSPGFYDVTLSIISVTGCITTETLTVENAVSIYPDPEAGFIVEPTELSIFDPVITITDTSINSVNCFYSMGDGITLNGCDPEYVYSTAGIITVEQTVENALGCTNQASRQILIEDFTFYVPNAFTPNNDGINDEFIPETVGITGYQIQIYDRWGQIIFQSSDPNEAWTGDVKGGDHYAQNGVYTYIAKVFDSLGFGHEFRGHISLIR